MAEGGDDGKRRCVLDVASAQGLQSYLKGALGAARAEAAAAPPPSGDAHRVRELRAEGFASYVKALSKRVQDEGVRPEFARFFVTKKQADELGRPSLETSHMPCDPGAHRAGHRCMKDCLLRLMVLQEDWLAHAAPVAERLAAARGVPRRDVAAAEGRHVGRAVPARGAALTEEQRSRARNRDLKLEDERVRLPRLYHRGHGHDPAARPILRGFLLRARRHHACTPRVLLCFPGKRKA